MFKSILPRDEVFFDKFEKIVKIAAEGSRLLERIFEQWDEAEALAHKIKAMEHEADEVVHSTTDYLHRTFVTPLDRSDIHTLTMHLDTIMDLVDAAASRIDLYKPRSVPQEAPKIAKTIVQAVEVVEEMVKAIRHLKKEAQRILDLTVEVDRLENEADQLRRTAMARLFQEEDDVKELMKWKEILEYMESATDRCEDVSDVLEGIVIANT